MPLDLGGAAEGGVRRRGVLVEAPNRGRHEQPSTLDAVEVALLDDALGPGEPGATLGHLARQQKLRTQSQGAPGGADRISHAHALMVGAGPDVDAVLVPPDQVRGHRHPLQVSELQRPLPVRRRQVGVRIPHAWRPKAARPSSSACSPWAMAIGSPAQKAVIGIRIHAGQPPAGHRVPLRR